MATAFIIFLICASIASFGVFVYAGLAALEYSTNWEQRAKDVAYFNGLRVYPWKGALAISIITAINAIALWVTS